MYCKRCGKENSDDSLFCSNCGLGFNGAPIQQPIPGRYPQNPYNYPPQKAKKKRRAQKNQPGGKKSGGKKPIIISAIIAAVILIVGINAFAFAPAIERAAMGETVYYLYRESKNAEKLFDFSSLSDLRHPGSYSADTTITAQTSGSASNENTKILNDLSLSAVINHDAEKKIIDTDVNLSCDDEHLAGFYGDYKNKTLSLSTDYSSGALNVPFSADKFVSAAKNSFATASSKSSSSTTTKTTTDSDALKESVEKALMNIVKNNIDGACTTKGRLAYNGKKYSAVTFSFTENDIATICKAALDEAKSNPDIYNSVNSVFSSLVNMDIISDYESFDEWYEDIYDSLYGGSDTVLTYVVYYTARGKIAAREITVFSDGERLIDGAIETSFSGGDIFTGTFNCGENYKTIYLYYSKTESSNGINLNINYSDDYSDDDIVNCSVTATNLKLSDCNGINVLSGDVSFEYSYSRQSGEYDDYGNIIDSSEVTLTDTYSAFFTNSIDGDVYNASVEYSLNNEYSDGDTYNWGFTLNSQTQLSDEPGDVSNVQIAENSEDIVTFLGDAYETAETMIRERE